MKTKKTLLFSLLVLIVCFGMFLGTTYAWFTDSVSSAGNIIQTGTLDVAMSWKVANEDLNNENWKDDSKGAIFNNKHWEPGYTEARHIKISNEGTLALKYNVLFKATSEVGKLADVIDVYYADPAEKVLSSKDLKENNKLEILDKDYIPNNLEKIREIIDNIKLTPINSKYKVYIIDEVHSLSGDAFNALLKTAPLPRYLRHELSFPSFFLPRYLTPFTIFVVI